MQNSYRKIASLTLYVVMILFGVMSVIASFVNLGDVIHVDNDIMWMLWVLDLLAGIVFIFSGANGLLTFGRTPNGTDKLFANSALPFMFFIFSMTLSIIVIAVKYDIDLPVKSIIMLIFYFLSIIGLGIASALKFKNMEVIKCLVGMLSMFVMMVIYFINDVSFEHARALTIISTLLFIFAMIGFMVQAPSLLKRFDVGEQAKQNTSDHNQMVYNEIPRVAEEVNSEPVQAPVMQKSSDKTPVEKLRELKQLKDEGILTEEEYREKAQKYKDQL